MSVPALIGCGVPAVSDFLHGVFSWGASTGEAGGLPSSPTHWDCYFVAARSPGGCTPLDPRKTFGEKTVF